jgi:thiol:disulfide interchange protein
MGLYLLSILPCALPSLQLELLSAEERGTSKTAKTSDFFFLSYVYNQFLCSLACTNTRFFSRRLEELAVFIFHIT